MNNSFIKIFDWYKSIIMRVDMIEYVRKGFFISNRNFLFGICGYLLCSYR